MLTSDDDELEMSSSLAQHFSRADKGRSERLHQELTKAGLPTNADAKQQLRLSVLKSQVEQQRKDQQASAQTKESQTFGTKTREQELKAATLSIGNKPSADQSIDQGKLAQAAKEARAEEEIQDSE